MATYDYRDPFATSTLNRTLMSAVDKLYNLIGCLMEVINNQNLKLASKNKENLDFIEEQRLKNILLFLLSNTNSQYFTDFEGLSKLLTFDIFDDNERIILFVHFITRSNAKMNDIQRTLTIKLRQYNRDMQKLNRDPYFNTEDKKAGGQLLTLLRLFHFFFILS